jgi:1,4-alpha-glucan branching enzyme
VEQAARELLLAQSSDWPFIVSTGAVADYATSRFNGHASDCHTLLDHVERVLAGGDIDAAMHDTHRWHTRDDLFPRVMPEIKAALRRTA